MYASVHTPSAPTTGDRVLIDFEIQIPMILTPRVEALPTLSTTAPTIHILFHTEDMLAGATKHRTVAPSTPRPDSRLVSLTRIVAADAGVVLLAAVVFDGDDV